MSSVEDRTFLRSDLAAEWYRTYARDLPVVDFHNHLSLKDLLEDRRFLDPADLWITPDPYKARAMRMAGVPERAITGDAPNEEKFAAWCAVFPLLIGNPLYQWSIAEWREGFGIEELPDGKNTDKLFKAAKRKLEETEVTPSAMFDRYRVEKACPCVSLFEAIPPFDPAGRVVPSLRADDALAPSYETVKDKNLESYLDLMEQRVEAFSKAGCRFSDHSLDDGFRFDEDDGKNAARFETLAEGGALREDERAKLSSFFLTHLLRFYEKNGMTVQFHLGARRETSSRLRALSGKAGGYASAGNETDIGSIVRLLDAAERSGGLPRVILMPLNSADTSKLATLSGSFSKDGVPGLVTLGPAWWWNDHRKGMIRVLGETAASGLLSNFIGMTTDSRSFLSLSRHDCFRRVLCSYLAGLTEEQALPAPEEAVGALIRKIAYENAASHFKGGQ